MNDRVDLLDLLDVPERADMNDALREWAAGASPTTPDGHLARATTDSPCRVCDKPARDTCLRCERPACASHRGVMTGLCDPCIDLPTKPTATKAAPVGEFDDEVPPEHPDLGIPWVE